MTELLVGTRKGLFVLDGEPGGPFAVRARAFAGEPVEHALRDPRSGRIVASVTSAFYGPKLWLTDDPAGEWEQASGVELPAGGDAALERIWTLACGEARRRAVRGRRPGRAVREPGRRLVVGAQPGAVGAPDAAALAAGRRRALPALDRHVARRARPARGRDLRGRGVADRGRRGDVGARQRGARRAVPARGAVRGRDRPLRAPAAPRAAAARSGSSCSSTAACTARTTPDRRGRTSPAACRRTSASRWRSTRRTRTPPTSSR